MDIQLLYCYFNLRSSIICCLFSEDIYLSSGISLSCSFVTISKLFRYEFFEALIILSAIKLPFASVDFSFSLFQAVLNASVSDCLASWRRFWLYLPIKLLLHQYF